MLVFSGHYLLSKKNIEIKERHCPHCGVVHELKSFDAFLLNHINFIIAFPGGKRHIVDFCDQVKKYYVWDPAKWIAYKQKLEELLQTYQLDSDTNPASAMQVHSIISSLGTFRQAIDIAAHIQKTHENSREVIAYLVKWYTSVKLYEQADLLKQTFRKQIQTEETNHFPRFAALQHLELGEFEKAKKELNQLLEYDIEILRGLMKYAQSHMVKMEYNKAYPVYQYILELYDVSEIQNFNYRKSIATCEKELGITDSLIEQLPWHRRKIADKILLATLGIGAILVFSLFYFYLRSSQKIYFSNQSPHIAKISINGEAPFTLHIGEKIDSNFSVGSYTIDCSFGNKSHATDQIVIEDGFFDLLQAPERLYDVDGAGLYIWEEITYASAFRPNFEDKYELRSGQRVYLLKNIDYFFTDSPSSIQTDKGKTVVKERWSMVYSDVQSNSLYFYNNDFSEKHSASLDYLKHQIELREGSTYLHSLYDSLYELNYGPDFTRMVEFDSLQIPPSDPVDYDSTPN